MKTLITLVVLCFVNAVSGQTVHTSPCNDSLYMSLKTVPMNKMTDREFEYFQQKDKDCNEFQKEELVQKSQTKNLTNQTNAAKEAQYSYIAIGIIIPIVAIVVLYAMGPN